MRRDCFRCRLSRGRVIKIPAVLVIGALACGLRCFLLPNGDLWHIRIVRCRRVIFHKALVEALLSVIHGGDLTLLGLNWSPLHRFSGHGRVIELIEHARLRVARHGGLYCLSGHVVFHLLVFLALLLEIRVLEVLLRHFVVNVVLEVRVAEFGGRMRCGNDMVGDLLRTLREPYARGIAVGVILSGGILVAQVGVGVVGGGDLVSS